MMDDSVLIPIYDRSGEVLDYFTIDAEDEHLVSGYRWKRTQKPTDRTWYVGRFIKVGARRTKYISLHRMLMGIENGDPRQVGHIDHNGLNNRRSNLRVGTHGDHAKHKTAPAQGVSGYRGVAFHKQKKKWQAQCCFDGVFHYLGVFDTPEEANDILVAWRAAHDPFSSGVHELNGVGRR